MLLPIPTLNTLVIPDEPAQERVLLFSLGSLEMGQGSGDDGVPPAPFSSAHSPAHSPLSVGVSSSATSSTSTPPPPATVLSEFQAYCSFISPPTTPISPLKEETEKQKKSPPPSFFFSFSYQISSRSPPGLSPYLSNTMFFLLDVYG